MSRFQNLEATPPDAAFSIIAAFTADESPGKVDLCPGFYRDGQARPWILPCVAQNVNPDIERRAYPYYAKHTQSVDFDGMVDTLRRDAASGDIVILHGCAHNPTGLDLTEEQWKTVANICKEKGLFPFFDLA
ncbi:hypothetical protein SLS58_005352 [Diplodia intermedia]|uniref:Aminotransferase class I/classII large domain-containing protein n=1 Tax=Diplodia intermedia TaxID=856260 RepID=A0ABR3TRD7_9PEZI